MELSLKPYTLQLRHSFAISGNTRLETPLVFVLLSHEGFTGYGEASLPPYLPETQETVIAFLSGLQLERFKDPLDTDAVLDYTMAASASDLAAKAAVDMALHDLQGKMLGKPCYELFKSNADKMPETSFTLGMDSPEMMRLKVSEASQFKILKIKLGGPNDKEIIGAVRAVCFKPLCVDANQGWTDKHQALEMIYWLRDEGVKFIEQPMPKAMKKEMIWLTENSPLPTIADESCQTLQDIEAVQGVFRGINIKLMKCGGIREARKMISRARELDLKILMGCMNESSVAVMAAASLAPQCNWADLDGPFLVTNNPFENPEIRNGRIKLTGRAGFGAVPVQDLD